MSFYYHGDPYAPFGGKSAQLCGCRIIVVGESLPGVLSFLTSVAPPLGGDAHTNQWLGLVKSIPHVAMEPVVKFRDNLGVVQALFTWFTMHTNVGLKMYTPRTVSPFFSEGPEERTAFVDNHPGLLPFRMRRTSLCKVAKADATFARMFTCHCNRVLVWGVALPLYQRDVASAWGFLLAFAEAMTQLWNGAVVASDSGPVGFMVRALVASCGVLLVSSPGGNWAQPQRLVSAVGFALCAVTRLWPRWDHDKPLDVAVYERRQGPRPVDASRDFLGAFDHILAFYGQEEPREGHLASQEDHSVRVMLARRCATARDFLRDVRERTPFVDTPVFPGPLDL